MTKPARAIFQLLFFSILLCSCSGKSTVISIQNSKDELHFSAPALLDTSYVIENPSNEPCWFITYHVFAAKGKGQIKAYADQGIKIDSLFSGIIVSYLTNHHVKDCLEPDGGNEEFITRLKADPNNKEVNTVQLGDKPALEWKSTLFISGAEKSVLNMKLKMKGYSVFIMALSNKNETELAKQMSESLHAMEVKEAK